MREIVRSAKDNHTQFAAIEWNSENVWKQTLMFFDSKETTDELNFNENIERLYKKWLVGEEVAFTIASKTIEWDVKENFLPTFFEQQEKNEYLARKVQKLVQQQLSNNYAVQIQEEIATLENEIANNKTIDAVNDLTAKAKAIDEKLRNAVAATKNNSLEQKWAEQGIDNETYLQLKPKVNVLFDKLKEWIGNANHINYNIIAPKVEALYAQSKIDSNYSETRKDLVALQKEVIATQLERWQKNELMDRLRSAFDHINTKQDEWRLQEDAKRMEQTEALQKKYDVVIPQATNSSFAEGFALLKDLQDVTNKSSILRDRREQFYTQLDEAFKTIKQKADGENDANFELATKQIDLAITTSKQTDLFKDARQILITAQNELKEIRLGRKQKDELFNKLRAAFDELNAEQDKYFADKRKENSGRLEDALHHMQRILARKKEGIETLYQAKENIEAKSSIIKVDKKSDGSVANMFKERLVEITAKVEDAEKDIVQLEKKVEKMKKELEEIKK